MIPTLHKIIFIDDREGRNDQLSVDEKGDYLKKIKFNSDEKCSKHDRTVNK